MKHKISHYNEELNELCDSLMALEFHLVCKLEVAHQVMLHKLLRIMYINTRFTLASVFFRTSSKSLTTTSQTWLAALLQRFKKYILSQRAAAREL